MKTLNLVDLDKSDIKYKISRFPDGQQNIVIESNKRNTFSHIDVKSLIQIKSRLNNWLDLELIVCAVASLRELGVEEIHLYTPYIMGARSDRKFEEGGNNYLRDVICPIINSLNFKTVTCIDPHSDVLEACIKGFIKKCNKSLVEWVLDSQFAYYAKPNEVNDSNFILIAPDGGSLKKIYKLAEQIGYKGDIITCSKDRDSDGKLTKTVVPVSFNYVGKDFIIIDDIADGAQTFINIAKELKREFEGSATKNRIFLVVSHGIFSKGFEELSKYFDGIYCTNSYKNTEFGPPLEKNGFCVKQLNVY